MRKLSFLFGVSVCNVSNLTNDKTTSSLVKPITSRGLYYTYLSESPCKTVDEIINRVGEKTEIVSWRTYFKRRRKERACLNLVENHLLRHAQLILQTFFYTISKDNFKTHIFLTLNNRTIYIFRFTNGMNIKISFHSV